MQPLFLIFWFGAGGYKYNNDTPPWQLYFIELESDFYHRICKMQGSFQLWWLAPRPIEWSNVGCQVALLKSQTLEVKSSHPEIGLVWTLL